MVNFKCLPFHNLNVEYNHDYYNPVIRNCRLHFDQDYWDLELIFRQGQLLLSLASMSSQLADAINKLFFLINFSYKINRNVCE